MNNIPEIRFPEFRNDGEWRKKKLIDFDELAHGDGNWILSKDITLNGEHKIVQLSSIGFGAFKEKDLKTISNKTFLELKGTPIQKGDLLINRMVDSGKINNCIFPHDGNYVTSVDVCWIRQNHLFNNFFFASLLSTDNSQLRLLSLSSGSGRVRISKKNLFENFIFLLPQNPQEQQKVADCLISLDEVIIGYEEKLKGIQSHKRGLMQNLFPQEGKTVPNYRFPEFENDGDWVEISLIDTADKNIKWSFTGGPFGSNLKTSDYTSEGIRIIQLQNIGDGNFNDLYKIYTSVEKADELLSCNIYSGDIILSKMGDPVGRACIMPGENQRFVMASDGIRLAVNEKKYSKYFIFSLINSDIVRTRIENKSTGSTRKRIGLDVLKKIPLLLPQKREEQQKIAECLSLVDELITQQINKIAHLKLHKKALMQGLFPKTE